MKCVSALSTARNTKAAFQQVVEQLRPGHSLAKRPTWRWSSRRCTMPMKLGGDRRAALQARDTTCSWLHGRIDRRAKQRDGGDAGPLSLVDQPTGSSPTVPLDRANRRVRQRRADGIRRTGESARRCSAGRSVLLPDRHVSEAVGEASAGCRCSAAWPAAARSPTANRVVLER